MAQLAARVSLLKNISIEALIYPGQLLNAEQYARWCEYQYTPDPCMTYTICKINPTTVVQSIVSYIQSNLSLNIPPGTFDAFSFPGKQRTISFELQMAGMEKIRL